MSDDGSRSAAVENFVGSEGHPKVSLRSLELIVRQGQITDRSIVILCNTSLHASMHLFSSSNAQHPTRRPQ